jgi:hypothetical protein
MALIKYSEGKITTIYKDKKDASKKVAEEKKEVKKEAEKEN